MALVVKDRVKESTTTTGTGTISLGGAFPGFQTFVAGVGSTNTTYYAIEDANGTAWEVGLGTVTDASPDTLSRSTILASSTGSAISLSSGTHTVFATYPADKAVYLDASGNLSHTVDISSDTNLAAGTGITLTGDTLSVDAAQTQITSVGTIATGTWEGTTIAVDQGGTGATTLNNLITLGTHTVGNYTATITAGTGITSTGATSGEGIAHGLSVDTSQTQITAIGTIATGTWEATDVAVAHGGTGASSAGDARTNLGLVIGTNVQAYDAQLDTLAALTADQVGGLVDLATLEAPGSDGQFIVATGSGAFAYESGATARASLGLSIGSDVQAYDTELAILAGLTSAANKIPYFTGSGSAGVLDLKDEDDMSSDSATALATQQSIKAYVTAQITAEDLDITTDSGSIDIDLNSDTLTIAGGTGISTSASGSTTVTASIDSTVTTLSGSQTLTNKTLTSPTVSGLTLSDSSIVFEGSTSDGYETTVTVTDPTADRTWTIPNSTDTFVGRDTTDTLANKTLTSPVMNTAATGTAISTETDMDNGGGASNSLLCSQLAIKTYVDNEVATTGKMDFVLESGSGEEVTVSDGKYIKFVEGGGIDIDWSDTSTGSNADPYDMTFTVQGYAGDNQLVTTGALNSGSITSGFGSIDTGSSTITTTGLISGGSLDIDHVLINGTNIGHTDDTDLLTLASGALTLLGTFTVGVDDAGHDVIFYGNTSSKYAMWDTSADTLKVAGDFRTDGAFEVYSTSSSAKTFYAKQASSHTGELIFMESSSGTDLFVVSSAGVVTTGTWQGTKIASGYIADDAIDSQHYANGSIDLAHMSANSVDSDQYVDGSIDAAHLSPDVISGQTEITSADADYLLVWDATDSALKKVDAGEFRGGGGGSGDITGVTLAGDSGTAEDLTANVNLTVAGGNGITTSGSSTTLTVALDAALTTVTSLLATDIKIGEDDQTKIDFETADEIHFYAANVEQVYLADNIFGPQSDSDVDLGTTGVRWKDAFVDSITVTGEVDAASLDISGNADIDGTLEADAYTVDGVALNEYIADTVGAMVGSNTETNITVTYEDGDNTLDFVIGTLNQDTTGTADNFTVSANNSADETVYPVFVDGATGSQGAETDTGLTYNPSSGLLTAAAFSGPLTGNVTGNASGTAATVTGGTQAAITSAANLVTVGTIGTGVWQGTAVALAYGGTGLVGATDGKIVVADGSGAPVAVQAFTANDGTLKHEVGGIEADISGIAVGDVLAGTGSGAIGIVTSSGHSDGDVLTLQADGTADWETASSGGMTAFILEDDDGTEVSISNAEEVKFIGSGITTNWTDTTPGSDGDPFDMTFTVDAAQTGITSILATDLKIGEDDQTKIDFETADEIHFYAANVEQVYLGDNIFGPQSDSDVDLGSTGVRWKDAFVDSITVTGEVDGASLDISGNADIDGTLEADAYTVDGVALNEYIADTVGAMVGSNTETGITVSYEDGDNTLDFVIGTLNQDTTGTAAIATTVTITDNEDTNEENAIIFTAGGDVDGGNLGLESDGHLTYNPSTGTVTATIFKGNVDAVDGDFDGTLEADAITVGGTNIVTGSLITTLGTISAGVWQGTAIASAYIADNAITGAKIALGSDAAGDIMYYNGTDYVRLAKGDDDEVLTLASGVPSWATAASGGMSAFILEDVDGTEVSISNAEEIKFIGSGITTNWTDTTPGSDGDPFDLTFTVDAAQTGITSILATDLKIGEDDQTKIDFETADEIHFYAANVEQVYLGDNIFGPQSDSDVDLGATGVRWKDAFVDSITVTGEIDGASLDISGNADIDGTLEADAITVDGATLSEYIADTAGAMFTSNTETGITATYQDGDNTVDLAIDAAQTVITSLLATDIKIGEDDQTKIDFETADEIHFYAANVHEVSLIANVLQPATSDGVALGTGSLMWSDLFLASGAVVNFNNGDVTLTHSGNTLTVAGGTLATAALTASTGTFSGVLKTDDTTDATSTTDGSLQTDGGLSVALDCIFGNDVKLLTDSSVLSLGVGSDATLTHDGTTGLTIAANPIVIDSGGNLELDSATGIWIFEDGGTEVLRFTEGNSGDVTVKLVTNGKDLVFTDNGDATNMKILDAAAGINVPGEVQTTGIGYTDGDNAMTIADGGKVTFAAGFAVGSDAAGDMLYHNGTSYVRLAKGSADQVLTMNDGATAPGWETASGGGSMSQFILEDDDGTEVSISNNEEVKFIGSGITTNWTDTSDGSDGDPFDLTFTVDAAQTGITSILAADVKIGEDDQTKIDFETADEIHFYAANVHQVKLVDNAFTPQADSDVDLGASGTYWKDAYIDTITTTGDVDVLGNIELGHASDTTIARASSGQITVEGVAVILAGAVTGITSLLATDIKIGEDDQTKIDFETANQINFYADNTKRVTIDSTGLTVNSGSIETATIDYTDGDNAITISDGGHITLAKASKPALKSNTDGSTVTFDLNEANVHTVTLGGNRTFAISNETAGQKFIIRILQDGTGSRTVTWFSTIKWAGGSAPTLTTTAGKADVVGFLVTGTDTYDGFVVGQNI